MNGATTPSELMDLIAGPQPARGGGTFKGAVNKVARAVSRYLAEANYPPMKVSRAEDIWRGEATPRFWEMDAIRRAAAGDRLAKETRNELATFEQRLARVEALIPAALSVHDPDFMRPHVDAADVVYGRVDRPVDPRGGR